MRHVTANEMQQKFLQVLEDAQQEPVVIEQQNNKTAVLLSMQEYSRLTADSVDVFENFCEKIGQEAKLKGMTETVLKEIID